MSYMSSQNPFFHPWTSCVESWRGLCLVWYFFFYKWTGEGVNMGVMKYVGKVVLLRLLLEHGSHRKLWEDLQVGCGWMIKGCMKLTVKHKALLTLCTQPWFLGSLFPGESLWTCAHSAQCSATGWKMASNSHGLLGKHVGKEHGMREGVSCLCTAAKCSWLLCFILALLSQKGLLELGRVENGSKGGELTEHFYMRSW